MGLPPGKCSLYRLSQNSRVFGNEFWMGVSNSYIGGVCDGPLQADADGA